MSCSLKDSSLTRFAGGCSVFVVSSDTSLLKMDGGMSWKDFLTDVFVWRDIYYIVVWVGIKQRAWYSRILWVVENCSVYPIQSFLPSNKVPLGYIQHCDLQSLGLLALWFVHAQPICELGPPTQSICHAVASRHESFCCGPRQTQSLKHWVSVRTVGILVGSTHRFVQVHTLCFQAESAFHSQNDLGREKNRMRLFLCKCPVTKLAGRNNKDDDNIFDNLTLFALKIVLKQSINFLILWTLWKHLATPPRCKQELQNHRTHGCQWWSGSSLMEHSGIQRPCGWNPCPQQP